MASQDIVIPNAEKYLYLQTINFNIASPQQKQEVLNYLVTIDRFKKQLKADCDALKRPFKTEIAKIDAAAKPIQELLEERLAAVRAAVTRYNQQATAEANKYNQKALQKFETKAATNEAKAVAAGAPIPFTPPPALKAPPPKTEDLGDATVSTVERRAWRIRLGDRVLDSQDKDSLKDKLDAAVGLPCGIPAEYFVLDTGKVGRVIRAGGTVPGVEVYKAVGLAVTHEAED